MDDATPPSDGLSAKGVMMIAVMAVALLLLHGAAMHLNRSSIETSLEASAAHTDSEVLRLRQSVLLAQANQPGLDRDVRANMLAEAQELKAGSGEPRDLREIQSRAVMLVQHAHIEAGAAGIVGMAEAALQLAILLVTGGVMMGRAGLMRGACWLAGIAVVVAAIGAWGGRVQNWI